MGASRTAGTAPIRGLGRVRPSIRAALRSSSRLSGPLSHVSQAARRRVTTSLDPLSNNSAALAYFSPLGNKRIASCVVGQLHEPRQGREKREKKKQNINKAGTRKRRARGDGNVVVYYIKRSRRLARLEPPPKRETVSVGRSGNNAAAPVACARGARAAQLMRAGECERMKGRYPAEMSGTVRPVSWRRS